MRKTPTNRDIPKNVNKVFFKQSSKIFIMSSSTSRGPKNSAKISSTEADRFHRGSFSLRRSPLMAQAAAIRRTKAVESLNLISNQNIFNFKVNCML